MRIRFIRDIPNCFGKGSGFTPNCQAEYECHTCEFQDACHNDGTIHVLQMEIGAPWWAWFFPGIIVGIAITALLVRICV